MEKPSGPRWKFVYLLNVAQRRLQVAIQALGEGATASRAGLLMVIPKDGAPMSVIGQHLDLGAPALSGLIDRTVKAGLVRRRLDPNDGRAWIIELTDAGRRMRQQSIENARRLNDSLTEGFSEEELAIVARWLASVRDRFPKEEKS